MIWNYVKSRAGTIVVFLLLYLTAGVVLLHCTGFLQLQSAMRAFFAQRCLWEPECGIFSAL